MTLAVAIIARLMMELMLLAKITALRSLGTGTRCVKPSRQTFGKTIIIKVKQMHCLFGRPN